MSASERKRVMNPSRRMLMPICDSVQVRGGKGGGEEEEEEEKEEGKEG